MSEIWQIVEDVGLLFVKIIAILLCVIVVVSFMDRFPSRRKKPSPGPSAPTDPAEKS